ncbi:MAG: hypothetical protein AAF684_05185 [Pseudomonadota bacterium]
MLVISPPRCGSMWLYNVARRVLASAGRTVKPDEIAVGLDNLVACVREAGTDPDPNAAYVVKAHRVMRVDGASVLAATSLRDPRDAVLSCRRFTKTQDTTQPIAHAVAEYVRAYTELRECWGDGLFVARYDDIVSEPARVVGELRAAMGFASNAAEDAAIAAEFSPDAVKRIIATAETDAERGLSLADIGQQRMMDRRTGFQSGHIGDGATGQWRDAIAPEQQSMIRERHGDWLRDNGFPLS